MNKIVILTCVYGRPQLTRLILEHYAELAREGPYDIELIAVGSEGQASRKVVEESGWHYGEHSNQPLSQKFNRAFEMAKAFDPDIVIAPGSDDVLDYAIVGHWNKVCSPDDNHITGLKDIYFYGIQERHCCYFGGFVPPGPQTIGAGRVFSRNVLEQLKWRPWEEEILHMGLDTSITRRFAKRGIREVAIPMTDTGGIACDFKVSSGEENLTDFDFIAQRSKKKDASVLDYHWPDLMDKIKALRK